MTDKKNSTIDSNDLLEEAKEVLGAMRMSARRAYVLELTGTPKSGKSTSLTTLQTFFKAAGFKVRILTERAADCPLPMKGHFFFNAWTTTTMLAEVLATHETDADLLILDRGFFDSLIWLELQHRRGQVKDDEKQKFANFVLLDRWRTLVDLTLVMTVAPETALTRENQNRIVPRTGSMMKKPALEEFNSALEAAKSDHGEQFSLLSFDTTESKHAVETNKKLLAEHLLPRLMNWSNPLIAVVPRTAVQSIFHGRPYLDNPAQAWNNLKSEIRFVKRVKAENDRDVVQIVACGIPQHDGKVLVLSRSPSDAKSTSFGKTVLWKGCHVEGGDGSDCTLSFVQDALQNRLKQELHLEIDFDLDLRGLVWIEDANDSNHLGLMFVAQIADRFIAHSMHTKEFRKDGRGHKLTGQFLSQQQIITAGDDLGLEPWSKHLIQNIKV